MSLASDPIPAPPRRSLVQRLPDILIWGVVLVILLASFGPVNIGHFTKLFSNASNMREFAADFMKPQWDLLPRYVRQMILTIQIAMWGTALAVVIAIPFGLACARNVSPVWLQQPMRLLMNLLRSIPDLVVGTLFIVAKGPR